MTDVPYLTELSLGVREVVLVVVGIWFGNAVGLHSAATSPPPEPLWLAVIGGSFVFTALCVISWGAAVGLIDLALQRYGGESA